MTSTVAWKNRENTKLNDLSNVEFKVGPYENELHIQICFQKYIFL